METKTGHLQEGLLVAGFVLLNLMNSQWQGRLSLFWLPCFFAWLAGKLSVEKVRAETLFSRWVEPFWLCGFFLLALSFGKSMLHALALPELSLQIQTWIRSLFFFSWSDGIFAGGVLLALPVLWILPLSFFSSLIFCSLQRIFQAKMIWLLSLLLFLLASFLGSLQLVGGSICFVFQSQLFMQAGYVYEIRWKKDFRASYAILGKCLFLAALMGFILWKFDLSLNFMNGTISGLLPGTVLGLLAAFLFLSLPAWLSFFGWKISFSWLSMKHTVLFLCTEALWIALLQGVLARLDHSWMSLAMWPLFLILGWLSVKLLLWAKKAVQKKASPAGKTMQSQGSIFGGRNYAMDLLRAFLILSMLVGHAPLDESARAFIFSYHMPAFILSSGWFYKPSPVRKAGQFLRKFWNLVKTFVVPYLLAEGFWLLVHHDQWAFRLQRVVLAMGFIKNNFWNLDEAAYAIGPVYFLLILFLIRFFALVLDTLFKDNYFKGVVVIVLCVLGLKLAEWGDWLFWSLDIALACLPFYYIGYFLKKWDIEAVLEKRPVLLYGLGLLWMILIQNGSFEIAVRNYGFSFGFALFAISAAFLVLYFISKRLDYWLWKPLKKLLALAGKNTLYILLVHSYFGWILSDYLLIPLLGSGNQPLVYLCFWILQCVLGILLGQLLSLFKSKLSRGYGK